MAALLDRSDSLPGEKDRHEMWSLLRDQRQPFRFDVLAAITGELGRPDAGELVREAFENLTETAGLNRSDRAWLRTQLQRLLHLLDQDRDLER